jgi:hypothetical protein
MIAGSVPERTSGLSRRRLDTISMQLAVSCRRSHAASQPARRANHARRRAFFETLEVRNVMAPLGAFPDDTGEYMMGDVLVTVVLMESDPTLPGADFNSEDWTPASINAVQTKVQDAMNWWKQTLSTMQGIRLRRSTNRSIGIQLFMSSGFRTS